MSGKLSKPLAIVMPIKGVVTHKHYFSQKLIPLMNSQWSDFLMSTFDTSDTQELIQSLEHQVRSGLTAKMPKIDITSKDRAVSSVETVIRWLMSYKISCDELKNAQVLLLCWMCWKGLTCGHVFDEIPSVMIEWKLKHGIKVCIYSSYGTDLQRLLLCNTNHGNVGSLINHFYDKTTSGDKQDLKSYQNIAKQIGVDPTEVLYLTDSIDEASNASQAGLQPILINRPGNTPLPSNPPFPVIQSFADIKW